MKKLFLICILILATQFVFAGPTIWIKTDNSNNKPVNAQLDFYFSADNNNNTQNLYHRSNKIDSQNDILSDEYYSTGKEGKGTVDLFSLYDIAFDSTGKEGKDTIEVSNPVILDPEDVDYSTGMEGKGTVKAYTPFVVGPDYWDYSTGMEGKTIETKNWNGYPYPWADPSYWASSTGMEGNDTKNLSGIRIRSSAKDKNAEIERELKQILLYTPGNTEKNDSTFLKVKVLVKEKLYNLMNIGA